MGWYSIDKEDNILREETDGRPVAAGEEGSLRFIGQEDFNHKVAVDLTNGVILIDYDQISLQNGTVEVHNPKNVLYVCDDTNILADLYDIEKGEPDREGWFSQTVVPLSFRPIWFTRVTNNIPAKIIGLQCTLPESFGGKNVKKMVILYSDGRVGIS